MTAERRTVEAGALPRCKHCGRPVDGIVHAEGPQWHLMRCATEDSGLPYGYNAEPEGAECAYPCLGWKP